ncbi:MAG: OFA family MFS transporter [Bacillota bacterium]|nr:OFA family MFS transporter [Bacillota bacterium]
MLNKRIIPLITGLLVYLMIGLIYGWSIFVAPLEAEFGWNRTETSATFTISMIFFCIGGILSGVLVKKRSPRTILILAAVCLCIGFICASRVNTITGLFISYGVLCGTGVGLAYNINISTVLKWYPDKTGLVSGLLLMCFGCGGMVLGSIASALIQLMGWRTTFVVLGVIFAAIILAGSITIKNPQDDMVLPEPKTKNKKYSEKGVEMNAFQMIRRPAFWLHFIWSIILSAAGLSVIGHASVCAQELGASVAVATIITGTISICNGLGRIAIGLIFDRYGRKPSVRISTMVMIIAFILLVGSIFFKSLALFVVATVILGLAFGTIPPINSAFTNLFYGEKNYALNFSFMNSSLIPASLLGPLVAGAVKTATGSYMIVFVMLLALAVCSSLLQVMIKRP